MELDILLLSWLATYELKMISLACENTHNDDKLPGTTVSVVHRQTISI
jgi:hypothetical protein